MLYTIELMFLTEFIVIKLAHQTRLIYVTIGFSPITVLSFNQMSAVDVTIY